MPDTLDAAFSDFSIDHLPHADYRPDEGGIRGVIKQEPEDFVVEEIPAYEPEGAGEHLFLWVEKRDLSSEQMTWHIARELGLRSSEIGIAGIKDRRAVTRQYVSVPATCEPHIARLRSDELQIRSQRRHRHKLRRGHLRGNRFAVLVRQPIDDALPRAQALAADIRGVGFPNYFGDQRFGLDGQTLALGLRLLKKEQTPRQLPPSRRRFLMPLALSSVQSYLFNLALADRLADGLWGRVLVGDAMQVVASGGPFVAEDLSREQPRCDAGEIVVAGPIFGLKMPQATGEPAAREARLLARKQLELGQFDSFPKLTRGTRRPYWIRPGPLDVAQDPQGIRLEFSLPAGVYATSLLREIQ
jgi:tRNA pseudouridine13 synthase